MMAASDIQIGIMLPTHAPREQPLDPNLIGATAAWAEAAGFDAVWAGDHIVHPWQFMESLTSLTFAAAHTSTIRIGTCVMLLPMRQLSILAAQIATISTLSGGRFDLGIGVGGEWPREWQAAGVAMKERGARLDDMLPLLRGLFRGETVSAETRFNSLDSVSIGPVPPPIPIYLAGRAPVALNRVGRQADGWIGFFLTPNGVRRDGALIDEARARAGRSDQPFRRGMLINFLFDDDNERGMRRALDLNLGFANELTLAGSPEQLQTFALAGTPERILSRLEEYIDAGCSLFCLTPIQKENVAFQDQIRILASEVLPKLRRQRT